MLDTLLTHHTLPQFNPDPATNLLLPGIYLARTSEATSVRAAEGECYIADVDPILDSPTPQLQRRIWDFVSRFPLRSLWNLEGIPIRVIVKHTWRSLLDDNLVGRAAELGFFFIFALFPSLFTATSLLGLARAVLPGGSITQFSATWRSWSLTRPHGHRARDLQCSRLRNRVLAVT